MRNGTTNTALQSRAKLRMRIFVSTGVTFLAVSLLLLVTDFVPEQHVVASEPVLLAETNAVAGPVVTVSQGVPTTVNEAYSELDAEVALSQEVRADTGVAASVIPVRIRIESIGIDAPIITPYSTEVDVLDRALLSGAVHYPESGLAGQEGNMLIFGHSSYLPVVKNKAFQAFDELGKLVSGSKVTVLSSNYQYNYVVREVMLADAEDTRVWFDADEPILTLATCNTFGAKQERWVVTATLASKSSL